MIIDDDKLVTMPLDLNLNSLDSLGIPWILLDSFGFMRFYVFQ